MKYFCSWSGGKDSCLALHQIVSEQGLPDALLNMLSEDDIHSRSHGLPRHLLQAQADAMGVPLHFGSASWANYEEYFIQKLKEFAHAGMISGVFGDLDLQEHRDWEEKVCAAAGMDAVLPLWHEDHNKLADEFIKAGFKAIIVTVNTDLMPAEFLGREYDLKTIADLNIAGVDVAGEGGEFHTFVYDGPIFKAPVEYKVISTHLMPPYQILELS